MAACRVGSKGKTLADISYEQVHFYYPIYIWKNPGSETLPIYIYIYVVVVYNVTISAPSSEDGGLKKFGCLKVGCVKHTAGSCCCTIITSL